MQFTKIKIVLGGLYIMGHKGNQVTYDNDAMMGYIYFSEPSKYKITYTEELPKTMI